MGRHNIRAMVSSVLCGEHFLSFWCSWDRRDLLPCERFLPSPVRLFLTLRNFFISQSMSAWWSSTDSPFLMWGPMSSWSFVFTTYVGISMMTIQWSLRGTHSIPSLLCATVSLTWKNLELPCRFSSKTLAFLWTTVSIHCGTILHSDNNKSFEPLWSCPLCSSHTVKHHTWLMSPLPHLSCSLYFNEIPSLLPVMWQPQEDCVSSTCSHLHSI
jgi:hypothetical protein